MRIVVLDGHTLNPGDNPWTTWPPKVNSPSTIARPPGRSLSAPETPRSCSPTRPRFRPGPSNSFQTSSSFRPRHGLQRRRRGRRARGTSRSPTCPSTARPPWRSSCLPWCSNCATTWPGTARASRRGLDPQPRFLLLDRAPHRTRRQAHGHRRVRRIGRRVGARPRVRHGGARQRRAARQRAPYAPSPGAAWKTCLPGRLRLPPLPPDSRQHRIRQRGPPPAHATARLLHQHRPGRLVNRLTWPMR